MNKINFDNEVIFIYKNIVIVIDDYDHVYFIDNGGIDDAYEIGDSVNSEDLTPLSELEDDKLRRTILNELNV